MVQAQAADAGIAATRPALIDSDVHCEVPKVDALFPYLSGHWIEHIQQTLFKGPVDSYYPSKTAAAAPRGAGPTPPPRPPVSRSSSASSWTPPAPSTPSSTASTPSKASTTLMPPSRSPAPSTTG